MCSVSYRYDCICSVQVGGYRLNASCVGDTDSEGVRRLRSGGRGWNMIGGRQISGNLHLRSTAVLHLR